jgi:hypothetical protein
MRIDAEGEFKEKFRDIEEVAEASMRLYMSDSFKGVFALDDNNQAQQPPPENDIERQKWEV